MTIRQISLNDFRNLNSTTLEFHKHLNIISGMNASGKTSLLEALHIICQGNSFNTHQLNHCIQHDKQNFLIFSKFKNYKAGFSRTHSNTKIRINNETVYKLSTLTKLSPVKIINSSSFNLILGSPARRREFIDWCLFHVEHSYHHLFSEYSHALKQRNALLKSKTNLAELDYWDELLAKKCEKIYNLRMKVIKDINGVLHKNFLDSGKFTSVQINYKPVWDTSKPFLDILQKNRSKDLKYGYTSAGIHRDDLKFLFNDYEIQNIFSRGEIKNISIFFILSQLILINNKVNKKTILLIDDISSELDTHSIEFVLRKLSELPFQSFITCIDNNNNLVRYHEEYKLFHVEHGMIKAVKN